MNTKVICLILSLLAFYSLCQEPIAIAHLKGTKGNEDISGTVTFSENEDGSVQIDVAIDGIKNIDNNEKLGLHVHEFGSINSEDGTSAGPHFIGNGKERHGCPGDKEGTHAGDLGNFELIDNEDGTFSIEASVKNTLIQLDGVYSILGRAVVLHSDKDDCNSQPAGNAGKRLAVGVIGLHTGVNVDTTTQAIVTKAICVMSGIGENDISGVVTLEQDGDKVSITADIAGIESSKHGFHIHQFGDIDPAGANVGSHYNPHEKDHGLPPSENRHLGDLGNLDDGKFDEEFTMTLSGKYGVVGRSMIIHENEDVGSTEFGAKIAQCVIGITEYEYPSNEDQNEDDSTSSGIILASHILPFLVSIIALFF